MPKKSAAQPQPKPLGYDASASAFGAWASRRESSKRPLERAEMNSASTASEEPSYRMPGVEEEIPTGDAGAQGSGQTWAGAPGSGDDGAQGSSQANR